MLKGLILDNFTLGGCGGLEMTDYSQLLLWQDMLIFNNSIFESLVAFKEWICF